jgi:hypothetical protein
MIKFTLLFLCSILILCWLNCQPDLRNEGTKKLESDEPYRVKDGKYDSEYPDKPVSDHLNEIAKSVHLISILAFYQSYHFAPESNILKEDLLKIDLDSAAAEKLVFEQPASGTAALIYYDNRRIAFLTCAHIIDYPDTIINYYRDSNNNETDEVKSFIYKVRQTNNVINQPIAYDFKILAMDKFNDIALIGKEVIAGTEYRLQSEMDKRTRPPLLVLDVPLGKAGELDFGTFVYLLGFPQAKKMVSTAIVSSPDYDNNYSFILDATLQKGISGGLVLGIRDGMPNFELVGITKAISGKTEYSLLPDRKAYLSEWELYKPYDGKIYLEKRDLSEPGMTFAIGIDTIMEFIEKNESSLTKMGYLPEKFFKRVNY